MNMRTDIFEHFVPIVWHPGHMGGFLQNFLTQEKSYPIPLSKPIGMLPNKEWIVEDAFDNFFGNHNDDITEIYNSLSPKYSGVELMQRAAIESLERRYKRITRTDDVSFEILKNNSSRYIKEHTNMRHMPECYLFQVKWKNKKINCNFSLSHSWIPYFLLQYKFTKSNLPNRSQQLAEYNTLCNNNLRTPFERIAVWNNHTSISDNVNEYTQFDIYNLVINKNLDQVYEIDPNFKFDNAKQTMLDLANRTTLEILESFGLDPTLSIDSKTTIKEVLSMQKLNPKL